MTEHIRTEKRRIPIVLIVLGILPLVAEIIYFGLGGLATLVQVFNISLIIGLVLVLVGGIGVWLALAGAGVPLAGFAITELYEDVKNSFEYWIKLIGTYIGILVGAYLVHILGNYLLLVIAGWLTNFIK